MPKNIVVYSDGTGQDGGVRPEQRISNVYKMYRSSRVHPDNPIRPSEQVCFYDPGLGTDSGASGLTAIMRKIDKLLQSVTGRGTTKNGRLLRVHNQSLQGRRSDLPDRL